ncbi:MAG: DapH/DapD/GlmU-related protein [Kofleriaceae bacterium]
MTAVYIDPTAIVEPGCTLGEGSKIWRGVHVMAGAVIGRACVLGQGCFVAGEVRIGDRCRIQNHVSLYDGVLLEDDVFLGPSCVFTNVRYPRAHVSRRDAFEPTRVARGATIGANATIVCGVTIGEYAMVGAGAVVTASVAAHALVVGAPARARGWVCRCGERLRGQVPRLDGEASLPATRRCARCSDTYHEVGGALQLIGDGEG